MSGDVPWVCRKAWKDEKEYLQRDRFPKVGKGRYTIWNCNKNQVHRLHSSSESLSIKIIVAFN